MYKIQKTDLNLIYGGIPQPHQFFLLEDDPIHLSSDIELVYLGDGVILINNQEIDLKKEPEQSYYLTTPFFLKTWHEIPWKISYDGMTVIAGSGSFANPK